MDNFKCVTDSFSTIKSSLDNIKTNLSDANTKASALYTSIESTTGWQGEAKDAALAFLDLTLQYNDALIGPVEQAVEAFQKYLDADGTFYDEWTEYQDMILV